MKALQDWGAVIRWQDKAKTEADFVRTRDRFQLTSEAADLHRWLLDALERDFDLLPQPTQEHIRAFLAERITSAQEEARASGDPGWRSRLAQILDYRHWFDLRLEYR